MSKNRINRAKLANSKWTAVAPVRREKHFMVTEVEYDEEGLVVSCSLEAIISKTPYLIDWQELKDTTKWLQGWK
ncbi:TIGR02450 family Trp-rich protein [Thaumasiovibrio subtropicus]|uniref:TIGR02450 family Trp-rich protein n=1 Tax=Thaumasiovibrio subtropicus TaxID=1891207 RepID=UPI001FE4B97B|nr:TIGR02450 family Trp-rich protein [Thaumasiovibrio subtropicus]